MKRSAIFFAATLLFACGLVSQTPDALPTSSNQTSTPTIRVNTEEVNLDMVFHDKKGKAVYDIRPEQVHVYEDGVEQHLSNFRFLSGEKDASASAPEASATSSGSIPRDPMRELRLVT